MFLTALLCAALVLNTTTVAIAQASIETSAPAKPVTAQEVATFFDTTLTQQLADEQLVGATVAVVKDGDLLFAKGYGYADWEKQTPVVADQTIFYPGSAGKLFTWTAVMQLAEQGKLDLHADINQYLDFTIPVTLRQTQGNAFPEPITLAHLMTHTAGFEEQLAALQIGGPGELLPLRDFLVQHMPARVYPPGEFFAYSNYGTALAGYIVERVSGEPYEQYITNHILQPLAMTHSAATQPLPPQLMADMAKGYHYRNGLYTPVTFEWIAAAPEAPVRVTATDMAHFMIAHLNGGGYGEQQLLQPATVEEMHSRQFSHDPRIPGMTYGFVESGENNQRIIWHMGESAHFVSVLALLPEQNVGLFVSYNTPPADGRTILSAFLDHFYPTPASTATDPPTDTSTRMAALQGSYVSTRVAHHSAQKLIGWLDTLQVQINDDQTLQAGPFRYTEIEPGLFKQVDGERLLTYRTDAQGRVTHLFYGPFAYFKVPWYQSLQFHLLLGAACLLLFLSAVVAWPFDWWPRRRVAAGRWAHWARGAAAGLALLNVGLVAWFLLAMVNYGQSYVYPADTVALLSWLWWPAPLLAVALVIMTVLIWRQHYWQWPARVHYTLVTLAAVAFVWLLVTWNLLALRI